MALGVIRDALLELLDELRALRARPYQTHLAPQDVEKLRGLIDAKLADDPPDSRHARVVLAGPDRAVSFGVGSHRAELEDPEPTPMQPDALLRIDDRPRRFDPDGDRRQDHERSRERYPDQGGGDVEHPSQTAIAPSGSNLRGRSSMRR